jgi:hypothetical protein
MSLNDEFADSFNNFKKTQNKSIFANFTQEEGEGLMSSFRARATSTIDSLSTSFIGENNPDKECCGLTTFQRYLGFGSMLGGSFLFFMISFFSLPFVAISPAKFALSYTMGSFLFLSSFTLLRGWKAHLKHLFCWERAPFTSVYLLSMLGCLYFSVIARNYIGAIMFTLFQVISGLL